MKRIRCSEEGKVYTSSDIPGRLENLGTDRHASPRSSCPTTTPAAVAAKLSTATGMEKERVKSRLGDGWGEDLWNADAARTKNGVSCRASRRAPIPRKSFVDEVGEGAGGGVWSFRYNQADYTVACVGERKNEREAHVAMISIPMLLTRRGWLGWAASNPLLFIPFSPSLESFNVPPRVRYPESHSFFLIFSSRCTRNPSILSRYFTRLFLRFLYLVCSTEPRCTTSHCF